MDWGGEILCRMCAIFMIKQKIYLCFCYYDKILLIIKINAQHNALSKAIKSWALIFIIRIRFPPGTSLATV